MTLEGVLKALKLEGRKGNKRLLIKEMEAVA